MGKNIRAKGISYKVSVSGKTLTLAIGYTPFKHTVADDVDVFCPN